MKTIRRLLGLYNEKELTAFGNYMQSKETTQEAKGVWHSDVSNFKAKLLLLVLAFGLMSSTCSTDDEQTSDLDCNCGLIVDKVYFPAPSNFTILKIKDNCTGEVVQREYDGNKGQLNTEWCGY